MDNHLISQFIMRGFRERPYYYDFEKGKLLEKQPKKIFFEKNFYSDEVEVTLCQKVEQPFSLLVNSKLKEESPKLTRKEMELIKKYMLLSSVRTHGEQGFYRQMKSFEYNAEAYLELDGLVGEEGSYLSRKKRNADLGLSQRELYMLALERYSVDENSLALLFDPQVTLEMYVWAMACNVSYLTIWSVPEGKQFLLTDCGLFSEYEGTRHLTGYDISKSSYLEYLSKHSQGAESWATQKYRKYTAAMYENFDFLPIDKNKILILIHPYFKMFFPNSLINANTNQPVFTHIPDSWPSCMETRELFEPPQCEYVSKGLISPDDVFSYQKKTLSEWEYLYLNSMMVEHAKCGIAFDDPQGIKESVLTAYLTLKRKLEIANAHQKAKELETFDEGNVDRLHGFVQELYQGEPSEKDAQSAMDFLKIVSQRQVSDFKGNPYIARKLLQEGSPFYDDSKFGFMGPLEERIAELKRWSASLRD